MNFKDMTTEELMERRAAIGKEAEQDGADLEALEAEIRAINKELEERKANEAKKADIRAAIAKGAGTVIDTPPAPAETPTLEEIRKSERYVNAYAEYIKTGNDKECRAILTETNPGSVSGSGPVPVPVLVDDIVRTAWEKDALLSRVRKTYFRGNLKVAFERSADAAVEHTEATTAPSEESLVLGIVTMIPKNIKKWINAEAA